MDKKQALEQLEAELVSKFTTLKPADIAPSRDVLMFQAGQVAARNRISRLRTSCSALAACLLVSIAGMFIYSGNNDNTNMAAIGDNTDPPAATSEIAEDIAGDATDPVAALTPEADSNIEHTKANAHILTDEALLSDNRNSQTNYISMRKKLISDMADSSICDTASASIDQTGQNGISLDRILYSIGNLANYLGDSAAGKNPGQKQQSKDK